MLFVLHLQMTIPSLAEHLNKIESENETKTRNATQNESEVGGKYINIILPNKE